MRFRLGLDARGVISGDLRPRVLFLTLWQWQRLVLPCLVQAFPFCLWLENTKTAASYIGNCIWMIISSIPGIRCSSFMPGFLITCHYNSLGTSLDKSHWIHTDLPHRFLSMPTCPRIISWVYVSTYFSSLTDIRRGLGMAFLLVLWWPPPKLQKSWLVVVTSTHLEEILYVPLRVWQFWKWSRKKIFRKMH